MKWRQYGRDAVLIDFAEKPDEWALQKRLRITEVLANRPPPQLAEFVPGFTNVLLEFDLSGGEALAALADQAVQLIEAHARRKVPPGPVQEIQVRYDGADLARVAEHNGIPVEKVIQYHCAPIYKVHLLGFTPGFPYLGELHHKLHTPRLPSPRLRVAPGSVAIGGRHTGIYTIESPGGWNIIGRTEFAPFDLSRDAGENEESAFGLRPGGQVKFVPVPGVEAS